MTKRDKLSRAAVYLASFAIPAAMLLLVYRSMGMAPWGDRTILISDMADQYVEFFCALKQGDVFFSWGKTMGTSYIGVFSYYVSSPLSILTLLVPNENMPVGLMFLTVFKLGLAGLSYGVYSTHKFPGAEITTVLCASCYGLMSYNIAFSLSIMWLDGVIWLPLILLALERVLAGKGAGPFIAALAVCFLSTWYISYMIGNVAGQLDSMKTLILTIILGINILVAVLMVKSFITKEKRELALLKAIGFKNNALILIQTLRIGFVLLISVIIGTLISSPLSSLIITPIFHMMGAQSIEYDIRAVEVYAVFPLLMLAATACAAFLSAQGLRNISSSEISGIE